jgi:DNA polymerase zeta
VEAHPRWRARVVYGDTDSMFVLLPVSVPALQQPSVPHSQLSVSCAQLTRLSPPRSPSMRQGRSREEAFAIGAEIAASVTAANPAPVTLKMEKVWEPLGIDAPHSSLEGQG